MDKVTVVKYSYENEKFEILVKPDPAFDYKLGKISVYLSILGHQQNYLYWSSKKLGSVACFFLDLESLAMTGFLFLFQIVISQITLLMDCCCKL